MDYLKLLRIEIERRYGRQPESPVDYNDLALTIRKTTGDDISNYTLMRIWGHVKDTSSPRLGTLSNLARYAGYAGWGDFVAHKDQELADGVLVLPPETPQAKEEQKTLPPLYRNLIIAIVLFLLGVAVGLLIPRGKAAPRYEQTSGTVVSKSGDQLSWALDMGTWTLTITGNGRMKDFRRGAPAEAWLEYRDSLRSVIIGEGVTHIGDCAFRKCRRLVSATLPQSCTSIGDFTFDDCSGLSDITLPAGLKQLGCTSFYGCRRLKEIVLPPGITRIETETFCYCSSLESCSILGPVVIVDEYAFAECKSLAHITLPEGLRRIGVSAFSNCESLQEMNVPEGVTHIQEYAFQGCTALTELTLPTTLSDVALQAFALCTGLRHIDSRAQKAPDLNDDVFIGVPPSTVRLTFPQGANYTSWETALGL